MVGGRSYRAQALGHMGSLEVSSLVLLVVMHLLLVLLITSFDHVVFLVWILTLLDFFLEGAQRD